MNGEVWVQFEYKFFLEVPSKKKHDICGHFPNKIDGGGQPHVKKFKWDNFLTCVREGGGHITHCQK